MNLKNLSKTILFIFHPSSFLILAGFLLLDLIVPAANRLWLILINVLSLYFSFQLATIFHEVGHLIMAWLAGGIPKRLEFGNGREVHRTQVGRIKLKVNAYPIGGYAYATFSNAQMQKWRYLLFSSGGVMANFLVALSFWLLFGFELNFLSGSHGIDLASSIIAVNILDLYNLLPFYFMQNGVRIPSDGKSLILIFQGEELRSNVDNELLYEAYECYERGELDESFRLYRILSERNPEYPDPFLSMSDIHLKSGELNDALKLLNKLNNEFQPELIRDIKPAIEVNLAWIYILKGDFDQALEHASLAFKLAPKDVQVQVIYGTVLVLKGMILEGMQFLFNGMDLEHLKSEGIISSIFLTLAYHKRGDKHGYELHGKFIRENIQELCADELMAWALVSEKF